MPEEQTKEQEFVCNTIDKYNKKIQESRRCIDNLKDRKENTDMSFEYYSLCVKDYTNQIKECLVITRGLELLKVQLS